MAACHGCKKDISGSDAHKMVTVHQQPDGSRAVRNPFLKEGLDVKGPLLEAWHFKHWMAERKRQDRAVSGDGLHNPTAYEMGEGVDRQTVKEVQARLKAADIAKLRHDDPGYTEPVDEEDRQRPSRELDVSDIPDSLTEPAGRSAP